MEKQVKKKTGLATDTAVAAEKTKMLCPAEMQQDEKDAEQERCSGAKLTKSQDGDGNFKFEKF